MNLKFKKAERIYKKDDFKKLFQEGEQFLIHPYKVVYYFKEESENKNPDFPLQFAVSIPKKRFKRAVDRNLLKRRTKEAFRLHRNTLKHQLQKELQGLNILLVYCDTDILDYRLIEDKIILILQRLQGIHEKISQ